MVKPVRMTITPMEHLNISGKSLVLRLQITNQSKEEVTIPQSLFNERTLWLDIEDDKGKHMRFPKPGVIPNVMGTLELPPITYVTLKPGEFWGSEKQISSFPITLTKPGKYIVRAHADILKDRTNAPQKCWTGRLVASTSVVVPIINK